MSMRNDTRVERARNALRFYVEAKGEVLELSSGEIADLMADLLHLAVRTDEGMEAVEYAVRIARKHFDEEHENPDLDG